MYVRVCRCVLCVVCSVFVHMYMCVGVCCVYMRECVYNLLLVDVPLERCSAGVLECACLVEIHTTY